MRWQKGLLSGWRLTALYGTLLNAAETLEALDRESQGERWTAVFQGDDVRLVTSYVDTAVRVAGRMNALGDDINLSKSFLSNTRDEFLRKVWRHNVVSGYPARAINSLLWRNPIVREAPQGMLRFEDLSEGWSVLHGRLESWNLLDSAALLRLWVSDVSGANNIGPGEVLDLMRTPRALGGLGALDYVGGRLLSYSVGKRVPRAHWSKLYPGVRSGVDRWRTYGVEGDWLVKSISEYWLSSVEMPSGVKYDTVAGELENSTAPRLRKTNYSFRTLSDRPHVTWRDGVPLAGREAVIARTKVSDWWTFLEPSGWGLIRRLSTIGWRKSLLIELALGQLSGSNPPGS